MSDFDESNSHNRLTKIVTRNLTDKTLKHPYFDRQMRIPQWDQNVIDKQVAFCLGVGGLGSSVAISLCRLGIKKIYLLDYDVVDSHNINRQALFSIHDIGKSKVTTAINALNSRDNIQTELIGMEMNALENWDKIVSTIKDCTVGKYF
jgi:molybdopterin/thiamine biosynthesis adenylyltransferase